MNEQLTRIRTHLSILITGTFLLTPIFGLWSAIHFGLTSWANVLEVMSYGAAPAFLAAMMTWVVLYFWYLSTPLFNQITQEDVTRTHAALLQRNINRYNRAYWGLFVIYSLGMPFIYIYSRGQVGFKTDSTFILHFFLLQLTISILIGMPAYLFALARLGKLAAYTGLLRVQSSLKSRVVLLVGFLPLLSYSLFIEQYWLKYGSLDKTTAVLWAVLSTVTIFVTLLTMRDLKQSLFPVEQALRSSGAVTHQALANLKPQSTDEIGYLTQTLARLFQRLSDQETHNRAIIDNAAEGIIVTNEAGEIDTFNLAAQNLFHYTSQEVRGKPLSWLIPEMLENDGSPRYLRGQHKVKGLQRNSEELSLSVSVGGALLSGKPVFIYLVDDESEREAALQNLQKAEAMYRDLVETAQDLVWSMDTEGHWIYVNNACVKLYGYTAEEMTGMHLREFQHPDYAEQDNKAFAEILSGKELFQFETVHRNRAGNDVHLSFNARAQKDENGNVVRVTGTARDITITKEYQRQLSYQAEHDALTGLHNRRFFQMELDRVIARASRSGSTYGLLYIDLDQFKYINDTLGHAAGDRLLIEVSKLLSRNTREGDLLSRFGGDEFTLLLYNIEEGHLETVAEHFRKLMDDFQFFDSGKAFNISCSIGATLIDSDTQSGEQAMSQADLACNVAKSHGRNCVSLYKPEDQDAEGMAEDMGWAARVKDMIDNDRFILAYQPIISARNGTVEDYEVLLRMPTDDGRIIMPGGFMPAAARFGLIHNIDQWQVRTSLIHLSELHQQGQATRLSVNLSDRAYEDKKLIPMIKQLLEATGLVPDTITFEISEAAIITNLSEASDFVRAIRDLGCHCALDDFGSAFCSFSYLKELPVDKLKIDGSVIRGVSSNAVDRVLAQSMIDIAHALGKQTIAESVEDENTLEVLKELGVDYVQGYYYGQPLSDIKNAPSLSSVIRPTA